MSWAPTWYRMAARMRKIRSYVPDGYDSDLAYEPANRLMEASLLTSEVGDDRHVIALDLDLPAALVPSTTEGHYHLYIDKELTWTEYKKLLLAMAEAGVIEDGYAMASIQRRATHLRTPWTSKQDQDADIVRK